MIEDIAKTKTALEVLGVEKRINSIEQKQIWTVSGVRTINDVAPDGMGNINTGLTTANATDLTDGGDTTLHVHKRVISVLVTDPNGAAITTGDGKAYIRVSSLINGWNLVGIEGHVTTVSSANKPSIALYNVTDSVDMLTVNLTIDANEKDSATAATAVTIDTTHDDVATGDELRVDIDAAGTGAKGLIIDLIFQK